MLAKPGVHRFILVLDHLKAGFNVAKIFRSAETFGAHEIHLLNIGPFDPSPAKGALRKVPARFWDNFDDCYKDLADRGYKLYALEPTSATSLNNCKLPEKSAFILGNEEFGLSFDQSAYPDIDSLMIRQFGETQSLNVSVAASIVMYEYTRQFAEKQ
jgi:tRNA G18 (ribose-2'-O)-methylase SpoU